MATQGSNLGLADQAGSHTGLVPLLTRASLALGWLLRAFKDLTLTLTLTPTPTRLLKAFKELVANDYPMAEALYAGGVFAVRYLAS